MSNSSGIRPVGVTILIKPLQVEQETESGIIMRTGEEQDREEMKQTEGEVIALGESAYYDENSPRCKVGDQVIMGAYSGMVRVGKDGITYRLILDNDVKAILEKE